MFINLYDVMHDKMANPWWARRRRWTEFDKYKIITSTRLLLIPPPADQDLLPKTCQKRKIKERRAAVTAKPESPGSPRLVRLLTPPRRSLAAAAAAPFRTPPWPLVPWLKKTSNRRHDWIIFFSGYRFKRTPSFARCLQNSRRPCVSDTQIHAALYLFFGWQATEIPIKYVD